MYHFKIQARNNKGYGPFSNIISFTTGPSEWLYLQVIQVQQHAVN
jgi:hypothetical protein